MNLVPSESVHLVITSPPYWQLKDYGSDTQIGYHHSYEDYINSLNLVWKECFRVLHKGCRLCVNIGDQFARSVYYGRYKVIPIREEIIRFCEHIGFDYMGAVIWQKLTTTHTSGGGVQMGSYPHPRNGVLKIDYEFILVFKKQGKAPTPSKEIKEQSKMTAQEWNSFFAGHWNFAGARQDSHIAMFPEELPRRLIKMFSFVGDTVLDPFAGSGTTTLAARNNNRNSIGYEINPRFISIIKEKIEVPVVDHPAAFKYLKDKAVPDLTENLKQLPYIFKDPHALNKKTDPKKKQFGSKIDSTKKNHPQEYYTVKEVISPEKLRLSNGVTVKLLGIKEDKLVNGKATDFLVEKTKRKRVFLKYDKVKYDKENNLLGYLYLENRTFLNAHLVKNGLAKVDTRSKYKYKEKFLQLSKVVKKGL